METSISPPTPIAKILLNLVGEVEPRVVLLSHGEEESIHWFTAQIHARYPKIKVVQPKPGVAVEV